MKKKCILSCSPWSAILLGLILIHCLACGKKEWPHPVIHQDSLSWKAIEAKVQDNCLVIQARLIGQAENLSQVVLLLEATDQPCPKCPFKPNKKIPFTLPCTQIKLNGQILTLTYCDLDPEQAPFRIQLLGLNSFSSLQPAYSRILELRKN